MATDSLKLEPQFDDADQQRLAATLGMWTFLATEILFFGGMIAGYVVYRTRYPGAWAAGSRELDLWWGAANTAVLLTSSLTMALAVEAIRASNSRRLQQLLSLTMLLGTAFLAIKGWEYFHKWREHLIPGSGFVWEHAGVSQESVELFYSFYFVMTGCHALHMLIGLGLLSVLIIQLRRRRFSSDHLTSVENAGLYWHFVDIVWVYLYPLLYLVDRSN